MISAGCPRMSTSPQYYHSHYFFRTFLADQVTLLLLQLWCNLVVRTYLLLLLILLIILHLPGGQKAEAVSLGIIITLNSVQSQIK